MTTRCTARMLIVAAAVLALPTAALAQARITGAIAGTVIDSTGSVVPGATVALKDELTGIAKETVANESGAFAFPDLNFGTYEVTVSLTGFRTAVFKNVVVESARTTDLRVKLEVGTINESVQVIGASPVLEVTTNTISNTLNDKVLKELPLAGRNVFTFARLMPGVSQPQGTGSTHYHGMPGGTINPTIDGINNASNGFKSGGTSFFGTVPARLGAIEEVTVESAGLGAESGAQGGVNLKFITRRGTSQYRGSLFWQHRNEVFNANSYFNTSRGIEKGKFRRHDYGGNFGGPLPLGPLRDKLFFFTNFEQEYIPGTNTQTNTILTAESEQGIFRYRTAAGEERTANLLQIAAANGFQAAPDPTIAALLAKQRSARANGTVRTTNSLITEQLAWVEPSKIIRNYPTARLDLQITPNLSWMGSWNLYDNQDRGRRQWPLEEIPTQFKFTASWWITSTGLNWTVSSRTHNEFRYGVQHSGDTTPNRGPEFLVPNGIVNGRPARYNLPLGLAQMIQADAPITGRHYITTIYDTVTLLRGDHAFKLGGTYRLTDWHDTSLSGPGTSGIPGYPVYSIGSPTGDPVQSIFNATTMPGIQTADLGNVYALYALLTGRLTRVQTGRIADPKTGEYAETSYYDNWTSSKMGGLYAQDSWRMTPNFTLNYGLRWEFATAPYNRTGIAMFPDEANLLGPSTRLFAPGELNGVQNPTIVRGGKVAAKADLVNPGPNAGFAWTPNFGDNFLGRLFGRGENTVIRGGYALTYYDEGTNMFASVAGNNPGTGQSADLRPGLPGFSPGGLTLQSRLPAYAVFPTEYADVYPMSLFTFGNSTFGTMRENLRLPYVQMWNIGVQRGLMKNTVLEVRYLGNRASHVWRTFGLNEVNIFENGFLEEFKRAQQNLAISQAAGGGNNFQNRGLPGQVPLPIFEAAFGARGSQAPLPSGSGYTNGTFINQLTQGQAGALADGLYRNSNYFCRMVGSTFSPCAALGFNAAGVYPINFFVANPYAVGPGSGGIQIVADDSYTRYNSLQLQLRRRYAGGVSGSVNYTLAKNVGDIWADNATQTVNYRTQRNKKLDEGPTPFDVRHVLQAFGTLDLPFGRDRRFVRNGGVLGAIVGNWTIGSVFTFQTGSPFRLSSGRLTVNQFTDAGVVLMNGLTVKELQNMIKVTQGPGLNRYWIDPKLIGPDGRANLQYLAPPTTPGEFGQFIYLRTPNSWNIDLSFNKQVPITNRAAFTMNVTAVNVLNHPVWSTGPAVTGIGLNFLNDANIQSTTFGQMARPANGPREFYLRGGLRF